MNPPRPDTGASTSGSRTLRAGERRQLGLILVTSAVTLVTLVAAGVVVERSARTPLVRVGQRAPGFALPSTHGDTLSLSSARGRPVVLAFVPSVHCGYCREQLRAIQGVLPELRKRGAVVVAVSTDTRAVQRAVASDLGLAYPLLSEAPTTGQHPVGSAYGVYHLDDQHPGPVDANSLFVIDPEGILRAAEVRRGRAMTGAEILALVDEALGLDGDG